MAGNASPNVDFQHELARVSASSTFSNALKQRELLEWLVKRTISGNLSAVSQYSIATGALGYSASKFDSTSDSSVRIAVKRLRDRLAHYYRTEGRLNRYRILIREGQYSPELVFRDDSAFTSDPVRIAGPSQESLSTGKLAVLLLLFLPIDFRDRHYVCQALTLNLMRALSASGQARVVPWSNANWLTAKTGDKREYYRFTNADVILEGLVKTDTKGRLNVSIQWIDGLTGLFDRYFEANGSSSETLTLSDDLATRLAHQLRVTYDERTRLQLAMRHSNNPHASAFYLKAREASLNLTPDSIGRGFQLVGEALRLDPHFASAHALLSELHLGALDSGLARASVHAPLARTAAQKSLALAPELGDAVAARGAIEFTYDWNLPLAENTFTEACQDLIG